MTPRRWPFLLVALLLAFPAGALADPVEITNSSEVEGGAAACSIWVEPAGEQYEWTFVCGGYTDQDGDGEIDSRAGSIWRDICQEDDPEQGSWCSGGELVAQSSVTAEQFTFDLEAGTAGLHANLGACIVDVDWVATAEAVSESGEEFPPRTSPYLAPPAVYLWLDSHALTYTMREAAMAGTVCPQAEVSGSPRTSFMLEYQEQYRTQLIEIDPTA